MKNSQSFQKIGREKPKDIDRKNFLANTWEKKTKR